MEISDITWGKRLKSLWMVLLLTTGNILHLVFPPEHNHSIDVFDKEDRKEIKAHWAYFMGNPQPLLQLKEEEAFDDPA